MWREQIYAYRDRFKRLDRRWQLLIGSQLIFAMMGRRLHLQRKELERQETAAAAAAVVAATTNPSNESK
jgi:hypothetical protein